MIQINDKYRLIADSLNIKIEEYREVGGFTRSKNGKTKTTWQDCGSYFPNVESAFRKIIEMEQHKLASSDEIISLAEFVQHMKNFEDTYRKALTGKTN